VVNANLRICLQRLRGAVRAHRDVRKPGNRLSEVREQAPHAATIRVQRWKIREWNQLFKWDSRIQRMRLHAAFMRPPLGVE